MFKVVLIGGGYTSVWAYRGILRSCRRAIRQGRMGITIVAPGGIHRFHGWTGEYLAGHLPERRVATPIEEVCPLATVIDGKADAIDLDAKVVRVGATELPYDALVFGQGSFDRGDVPGMREFALSSKEPSQCGVLRQRIADWPVGNGRDSGDSMPPAVETLAVVGGGLAGVEMSAAIAEKLVGRARVVLVHSGDRLLPELAGLSPRLARYAERQLRGHGIEIRTGNAVEEVTEEGLRMADGTKLEAALVVTTLGQSPVVIPGTEELTRDPSGRLLTTSALEIPDHPGVFAGGDVASARRPLTSIMCPANALWALKHGTRIGINVARVFRGTKLRRFVYPGLGLAGSLGRGKGILRLYRVPMTGWLGWLLRAVFFLRFMPSRAQAVKTVPDLWQLVRRR